MENVREIVRDFLLGNFFRGEPPEVLSDDADLQERGVLDSLGTLKLVSFLEERFQVEFLSEDLGTDQLSSVDGIESLVRRKLEAAQVFFLGVSATPLGEKELAEFEGQTAFMRKLLPADELVAEFEFPERPAVYEPNDPRRFRARGADLVMVLSPKSYATDHSNLQKWFSAYHGWIVATEP